jgi:hypothetical protein
VGDVGQVDPAGAGQGQRGGEPLQADAGSVGQGAVDALVQVA